MQGSGKLVSRREEENPFDCVDVMVVPSPESFIGLGERMELDGGGFMQTLAFLYNNQLYKL